MTTISEIVTSIDFSLSFTNSAKDDVSEILEHFDSRYKFYDYRQYINLQSGYLVESISEILYQTMPTIIMATPDWFVRQATIREKQFLLENPERKLVFDYSGKFTAENLHKKMKNVKIGTYIDGKYIDLKCLEDFLSSNYRL